MAHNRDILWKGLQEQVFDDMMRFVHPKACKLFDLDKELAALCQYPARGSGTRFMDKLVNI